MEELITKTRIRLQNQSAQSYGLLKQLWSIGYLEGYQLGIADAQESVDDWIAAEKVRDLWEEQK